MEQRSVIEEMRSRMVGNGVTIVAPGGSRASLAGRIMTMRGTIQRNKKGWKEG